jgi:hypothetical protein
MRIGQERDEKGYEILVGKPEGKRPVARPKRRGEDTCSFSYHHFSKTYTVFSQTGHFTLKMEAAWTS